MELRSELTESKLIMLTSLQESQKRHQSLAILQAKYSKLEEDHNAMKEQFLLKEHQVNILESTVRSFNSTAASQTGMNKISKVLDGPQTFNDGRSQEFFTPQSWAKPRLTFASSNANEKSPKNNGTTPRKMPGQGSHTTRSKSVINGVIKEQSEVVVTPKVDKQRRSPHSEMGMNPNSTTKYWLDDKYKSPQLFVSASKKQKPKSNDNSSNFNSTKKRPEEIGTMNSSVNNLHSKSNKSPQAHEHSKSTSKHLFHSEIL